MDLPHSQVQAFPSLRLPIDIFDGLELTESPERLNQCPQSSATCRKQRLFFLQKSKENWMTITCLKAEFRGFSSIIFLSHATDHATLAAAPAAANAVCIDPNV